MRTLVVASLASLALAAAAAAPTPTHTRGSPLPVQDLALAGRSIAYVADAPRALRCGRIGYWRPGTGPAFTIDARELCADEASTGQGIWDVSVATGRLLWITYTGGNFREWFLWTATTTRRTPRQLRFVARDVDSPPPLVLGPGTPTSIPYAVDREVVLLGDDGRRLFSWTSPDAVRAVAAGPGPRGWRVAVLRADGAVDVLDSRGRPVDAVAAYPPGEVLAIRLSADGVLVQIGPSVDVVRPVGDVRSLLLPRGARMVGAAQGRILWARAGDLGATTIASGASTRLVDGTTARPVLGQLEGRGLAWAQGRFVHWRAGALP